MSSAIVFIPVASSYFPGIAAVASTGVGIPVVLASTAAIVIMSACAKHFGKTCTEGADLTKKALDQIARQVETDLKGTMKKMTEKLDLKHFSQKSIKTIGEEMDFILNSRIPKMIGELQTGTLSESAIESLRDQMDNLDWMLNQHQAFFVDNKNRYSHLTAKVGTTLAKLKEKYQDRAQISQFENLLPGIDALPDSEIEKKIEALELALGNLECISDESTMQEVLNRLLVLTPKEMAGALKNPRGPSSGRNEAIEKKARARTLKNDLEYFLEKLRNEFPQHLDKATSNLAADALSSDLQQRVAAIRDQVKILYQQCRSRVLLTEFFRGKLKTFLEAVGDRSAMSGEIRIVLEKETIERADFTKISSEVEKFLVQKLEDQQRLIIEEKVRNALSQLEYVVVEPDSEKNLAKQLAEGKMTLMETKYPDYKLLLRYGKDQALSVRLIRVVEQEKDKENVSEFQKQKDRELKTEWCKNADALREHLAALGVLTTEKLRLDDDIQYVTLEQLEQQRVDTSTTKRKKGAASEKKRREKSI